MAKILYRGAEALILEKKENNKDVILKQRIKKGYRIPAIDEKLRKYRTRTETRIIERLHGKINVPRILSVSEDNSEIEMEFIEGRRLSDYLDNLPDKESICLQIGEQIAKLHDLGIIHGDLTTSNMILKDKENKVYFIDFGLAFMSASVEDKAVDLHLLRQALEAKHFTNWKELFEAVKEGYKKSRGYEEVIKRFEKVEKRGRYKSQI